jgi:GNAT superfamily N-acetyltransferase
MEKIAKGAKDVLIRKACAADSRGIARVRVDTWRTAYAGLVSDSHLRSLRYETVQEQFNAVFTPEKGYHVYVAEEAAAEDIIGFILAGANRNGRFPYRQEIYALYVRKEYQAMGAGHELLRAVAAELGSCSVIVWVLAANPYRRFYEKLGGTYAGSEEFVLDGEKLTITGYGWNDIGTVLAR